MATTQPLEPPSKQSNNPLVALTTGVGRILISLFVPILTFAVLYVVFDFLRDSQLPQMVTAVIAVIWGVGGVAALYGVSNWMIEQLPHVWVRRLVPYVFVGPAIAILMWYLAIPTVRSLITSLQVQGDANAIIYGLDNYIYAFTNGAMTEAFRNNLIWLVVGTTFSVGFGLLVAVLADRTHPQFEATVKALIFMPMVISMVGASVIWRFVYEWRPPGQPQIGLLNGVLAAMGQAPVPWIQQPPWNTFFLIVILIWLQTGYAMVIFSSAIKGMPEDLLEAGRIDGANEFQIFSSITIPYIQGTIVTVATTIILFTLKIFDIVRGMTGGRFGTQVIANVQYDQQFRLFNEGRAAAIAIVLLIAVLPVMYYNLRQFSKQTDAF